MNEAGFAAYVVGCGFILAAQLVLALREWRVLPARDPMVIDQLYVRVERYFGLAFRAKLDEWLRTAKADITPQALRAIDKGDEQILLHDTLSVADDDSVDGIVVADRLVTGRRCRLTREVYTRAHCLIGAQNVLQAIAADGDALIGRATRVMRWVDAAGEVLLEPGCRVLGRVTSAVRVLLATDTRVRSVHAPIVVTINGRLAPHDPVEEESSSGGLTLASEGAWAVAGAGHTRRQMSDECVAYDGDLSLPSVTIPGNLVVHGSLTVGPRSVLRGDVKASGTIHIGEHSVCEGSLVSGRDIHLGRGVRFHSVIFAEGAIRIGAGTLGTRPDPGVAVYGATTVILGPDVEVHGKIAAGRHVLVASD